EKMKLGVGLGVLAVAVFAALETGCGHKAPSRLPAPSVEISMRAMLISFAQLQQLPAMKTPHGKALKADSSAPGGHGRAAQARDFMQMEIHLPKWVATTVAPEPPRSGTPQKRRLLQTSAPTSGNLGTV